MADIKLKTEEVPVKSPAEHAFSATKYVATATAAAYSITNIIVFVWPKIQPIGDDIQALMAIVLNVLLVFVIKSRE